MRLPGELSDGNGEELRIRRAWPRSDGSLVVEGREAGSDRVRAGHIDADGRVSVVPFREDPALRGLSSEAPTGDLLVHRLKRRAVVRLKGQYRKFISRGKASSVAHAHLSAAACLAGSGLAVPDVVASDDSSVTLAAVPGMSLHELGRMAGADCGPPFSSRAAHVYAPWEGWGQAWELWTLRWPEFVNAQVALGSFPGTRCHTPEDEAGTVERWVDFAVDFEALGVSENRLRNASASVVGFLLGGESPVRLAHRDLHDKQVLIDPGSGSLGIIDCDTLALAEPALDLANLSIHLDFRVAQGLLSPGAAALGKHRIREVAEVLEVPEVRFDAYAAATALRLACIYAFRPPYRATARIWFSRLEERLKTRTPPGIAS